jgi:hypothetical protein
MTDSTSDARTALRERFRASQTEAVRRGEAARAQLPLPYLRQQAHLTAPASEFTLAQKALTNAHAVSARLMDRYGIEADELASRLDLPATAVAEVLGGRGAPVVLLDPTPSGSSVRSTVDRPCVSSDLRASRIRVAPMTSSTS